MGAYPDPVDATTAALIAAAIGTALGAAVATLVLRRTHEPRHDPPAPGELSPGIGEVLDALRMPSVVIGADDRVVRASAGAHVMGLVRGDRLFPPELATTVAKVRTDGRPRDREVVRDPALRDDKGLRTFEVHVGPLSRGFVVVLADDVTESRRLDTIRRDFVANVSHELKTPTGALALLAEAMEQAAGDPEAVRRFAHRMNHEATRLGGLITELIDLTRVQDSGPLREPAEVRVDAVVAEAIDAARMAADARRITVVSGGTPGLIAYGDREQLVTALKNLVTNAIAYSPETTRVAVATRGSGGQVEVSVTDQGIGIPSRDLDRIFERFYRVDPARSRQTGGTGLGLSIVKHVVANHGGEISVWSVEGEGSTFTMRLPAPQEEPPAPLPAPEASESSSLDDEPSSTDSAVVPAERTGR
jgi:two-component system sensor histidine kinase SenX3